MATISRTPNVQSDENELNLFFSRALTINWEVVAYLVIFTLAVLTRFYALGDRTMSHDESLHTQFSYNLYQDGNFEHTPLMHGPILFHFTALSYWLFGDGDFSARVYTAVLGVAVVMFPVLFRRWIGRTGAVLAALMLLISPLMLYYSRYIRHDIPSILSALLMFWAIMMYLSGPENQRRRAHWLYIIAVGMIWNLGSKETAFIYVAIFGIFIAIYWFFRLAQHYFKISVRLFFETFVLGGTLAGMASLGMIVIISIALADMSLGERLTYISNQAGNMFSNNPSSLGFVTFLSWTGLLVVFMVAVVGGTAMWVYRSSKVVFSPLDIAMGAIAIAIVVLVTSLLSTVQVELINEQEVITNNTAAPALAVGLLISISVTLIYAMFRLEPQRTAFLSRQFLLITAIMFLGLAFLIGIEELSHVTEEETNNAEVVDQPVPGEEGEGGEGVEGGTGFTIVPLVAVWVLGVVVIGAALLLKQRGLFEEMSIFPEFDLLIVIGTLILPWATAIFIVATRSTPDDFISIGNSLSGLDGVLPVTGAEAIGRFAVGFIAWVPMMAMAIVLGLLWNWRRWLIASAIFHAIFAFFFTTVFTNIEGLASGMVYSLQYWLEQQEVRRGNQPQYYYLLIIMPIYEFLPIIGAFLATIAGTVLFWKRQRAYEQERYSAIETPSLEALTLSEGERVEDSENTPKASTTEVDEAQAPYDENRELQENERAERIDVAHDPRWQLTQMPFLLFVGFWGVVNLFGYTLAGEKMPWLGTHLTLPLILLSAWYFGRIFENVSLKTFSERGWIYTLLLPFLFVGIFQLIAPYLGGQPPFSGTRQLALEWTYSWLAVVAIVGAILFVVYRVAQTTGWPHLRQMIGVVGFAILAVMTFRTAWMASFVNADQATEFLVYAHAGPANKEVTNELRELSFRITDGLDLKVMHDDRFSWPGSWYLRDFDNRVYIASNTPSVQQLDDTVAVIVGDSNRSKVEPLLDGTFQRFDHIRMWWPLQDYMGLNAEDMSNVLDFERNEPGQLRRGIFDIWWNRDYTSYGDAVGREITLTDWPVSDRMHLYVRRDYAAQIWPYGVGGATAMNPFTEPEINLCVQNWELRAADVVFDTSADPLINPVGVDVNGGMVYVAEEFGHEISIYSTDGSYIGSFGQQGTAVQEGAFFERPHSIHVGPDGNYYIADTWNYRVRVLDQELNQLASWGQPITAGFEAQQQPTDGLWGPRDIYLDAMGRVYVSDTGNKRIRVYDANGTFIRDIGSGGSGDGQLNESTGLVVDNENNLLYVGDTRNRRVAVFTLDGLFVQNIPVRGWREEDGNRPYLALDNDRDLLYVTDPDAGRILIYDTNTNECLASFGQVERTNPDSTEFAVIGGIDTDENGNLYVVDTIAGRLLRFAPFERPAIPVQNEIEERPPIVVDPEEAEGEADENVGAGQPDFNPAEATSEVNAEGLPFNQPNSGPGGADGNQPPDGEGLPFPIVPPPIGVTPEVEAPGG